MDLGTSTLLIGGAIGLALAVFGVRILITGRTPAATGRAFRTARDAGMYHLLFGVALTVLALGSELKGIFAAVSAVVAVVMVAVAVARHRPRGRRSEGKKQ
jgi:hypothetical protein